MIIDGQAEFRCLLRHHITTQWADALVAEYDPTQAGHLPDEFSGAANDVVLLGDDQGDRDGQVTLRRFLKIPGFPPVIYFAAAGESGTLPSGVRACMPRDKVRHATLIGHIESLLCAKQRRVATDSVVDAERVNANYPSVRGYRFVSQLAAGEHAVV